MSLSFRQSSGIEAAPLQDEIILFHASSNKFCVLNRTSTFIWSQLKEPATQEEIALRLGASFSGVTVSQAMSDVDSALKEMLELGLIVSEETGNGQQERMM
jgi:Coenzyme PQQ synthesis protein D (PqqD)